MMLIFTKDRDPHTCGRCGRPHAADTDHPCLNDDGSSIYFQEKNREHGHDDDTEIVAW
jgi:hypothetical protein